MAFTHLHVHTAYSLLDGAARIKDLVDEAQSLGMKSLAITDHGVMFGVIDFYRACKKADIKPILGCEVYTAARTMKDRDSVLDRSQGHLVLLAKDNDGYKNLMKIVSAGYTDGFYYKPRVDKDLLRKYSGGLIALSGCLAGDTQQKLLAGDYEGAKTEALTLREIFGEENFYLEIQDQGLEEERQIIPGILRLHEETGIPLVATNDIHYVRRQDAKAHDVLLCIQTGKTLDDENRMRFTGDEFYLKSEEEMTRIFGEYPGAIENTQKIAEACNVEIKFGEYHLPEYVVPEGYTKSSYFRELCQNGAEERYGKPLAPDLQERLDYELTTIENMGYVEYFLIVWDFINYAKSQNIMVGPGRGSAAGSIVAYSLRITDIDPIRYSLIFERFLNPERVSMPDIDIDFCIERRQEVIEYVNRKYGEEKVSQIITFGTMKAKMVVRDVGRAMNMPYAEADAISKMIPNDLKMTLDKALEVSPDLKKAYDESKQVRELIDTARVLEGMPRHASTHAAGVVISRLPLDEYVPLYVMDKGIATQFTMTTIEELGLLKMDFLGLRNLTIIRDALAMIKENHGVDIDFAKMTYDDPAIFELIGSGNTMGVFQLESGGMTSFMKNLRPTCFEDIVAGISLYRPGPMDSIPTYIANKKDPSRIKYIDPSLEPILSVTYGCMVYQEQVMQIVRDLGGYTYGRSDEVRRAMGKKKIDVMEREREYFIYGKKDADGNVEVPGCISKGIPEAAANEIYDQMVTFAQYAFNKSHAAAYAVVAYETAYLKAHYPVEFMAALMGSVMGDATQIAKYIRNCADMGISVLPPDVNESEKKFTATKDGRIRFGLQGVKNVGEGVVDAIIAMRKEKGPVENIFQLVNRADITQLNKKAMESLIRAGAFDSLNPNRAQYLGVYEQLMDSASSDAKKTVSGQLSLFQENSEIMQAPEAMIPLPNVANFPKDILIGMEKEMLGVYISGHPLDDYAEQIKRIATVTSEQLHHAADPENHHEAGTSEEDAVPASAEKAEAADAEAPEQETPHVEIRDGMDLTLAGIVNSCKTLLTKSGKMMAFLEIEDLYGALEVVVFPKTFESCRDVLKADAVIAIKGKLDFKDDVPKVLANKITALRPDNGRETAQRRESVRLRIAEYMNEETMLARIKEIMSRYPGEVPVIIYSQASGKKFKAASALWVDGSDDFMESAIQLLGSENVK